VSIMLSSWRATTLVRSPHQLRFDDVGYDSVNDGLDNAYRCAVSRVLVVDDDTTVSEVVTGYLTRAGHDVACVGDGRAALDRVAAQPPDLVVLDLMIPLVNGLEVCRRIRAEHPAVLVIMLTALSEAEDRISGLEVGADDYVTKPFSPRELVLRVDSVLRRVQTPSAVPDRSLLSAGDVTVDVAARRAFKAGAELALTVRELDLLTFLLNHPGVAYSRAELMSTVWGWTFGDQSTVTVHVRRLREKVEDDASDPKLIQTVWGVGYRMHAA
jgi:two-component system response regulator ResD